MDETETPLAERTGTFVLDFEDRRRLAVAEVLIRVDHNGGFCFPVEFGDAVLHNEVKGDEPFKMAESTQERLVKLATRGY